MGQVSNTSDIAIIGLALRVPGAKNAEEFWNNLRAGKESIEDCSPEELAAAGESLDRSRRKNYVPRTARLPGMADFDAEFFGFSPKDAAIMDPQHRQFLECAWEAMEDATRPPERNTGPVGVFAGCGMGSYFYFNVCSNRQLVDQVGMFLLRHTGNDKDFLATRASYIFDLHGPSVNVQTACSTSLVAVHYAAQSLLNGECDMALAGGVTIELPHGRGYLFQEGEILSPDGHCRAFDHRAAGTVFGSGVGVVVLRRLEDALADGDPIRGVIRATAINNDGAGKVSYLAPSVTGQAEAVVEAQALAGVTADTIQYVECHGTGTSIGDPIEVAALTQAFQLSTKKRGYCRIGSVKSNIGHLDTAAGVVSLIKAVLSLENDEIPPSLGYEAPNPAIDFDTSPFAVADKLLPWPRTATPRRAGINSLGVGGTNAHAIVEEAPTRAETRKASSGPQILVTSARSRKALDESCERLAKHLAAKPDLRIEDVAHTLVNGRRVFKHRRVVAVADRDDAIAALGQPDLRRGATHTPIEGLSGAVLMFPGGGAQYPGMGRSLYAHEPIFAKTVDEGLSYLPEALGKRIRELWLGSSVPKDEAAKELLKPSLQLPAILIIEVALARLLQSWNIKPVALIGHSMGEYAAACIAQVMTFQSAVRLVQLRGELFDEITGGGMLSVQIDVESLRARLPDTLDLAVINAPELCVASGPEKELAAFHESLAADGIEATRVPINIAAHSRMLEPILGRFEAFLRQTALSAPQIPIISNFTGDQMTAAEACDPLYWVRQLRSTVRFSEGMSKLAASQTLLYIEAGPGKTLSSLAKAQGIDANATLSTLPHAEQHEDDHLYFLTALGRAWATGLPLPIERLSQAAEPRRVRLPSYPFQHQHYFIERVADTAPEEVTPSKLEDMANWGWAPVWKPAYPEAPATAEAGPMSYLIFLDDTGFGERIVTALRAKGSLVTTVTHGDAYSARTDGSYTLCAELGRQGYDALFKDLAATGRFPTRIIHAWLLTAEESFRPGSSFFHRNQERGLYSLVCLAQALGEVEGNVAITVLTNGAQRLGDEGLPYPEKATVLGPVQVLPREMPNVKVCTIDIPSAALRRTSALVARAEQAIKEIAHVQSRDWSKDWVADLLLEDIFANPSNDIIIYRNGRRLVRAYREVRLDPASPRDSHFREHGVYLITGGLGDLALRCALDLAQNFSARIALIGRLELPDRATWNDELIAREKKSPVGRAISAIRDIENAGGDVLYVRADITNPEMMREAVATIKSKFGTVNGVLHAAGIVNDDLIQLKTAAGIEDVLAPKVLGTIVLDEALKDENLDVFVLFSSTSTDIAPAGQVDYVAANAYLNAFAESRTDNKTSVVAIHWGLWSDVGIAARAVHSAESGAPQATVTAVSQPLFENRTRQGASDWLELHADPSRDWLLNEHRLRTGEAVWPGTGYLELIVEAAREYGIQGPVHVSDLTFLRPLHVPDGDVRKIRVLANPDAKQIRFAVESLVNTPKGPAWLRHAEANASREREQRPRPVDIKMVVASTKSEMKSDGGRAMPAAQDRHLRFGPRWQVLRETSVGQDVAVARLALDDAFRRDIARGLAVHPALLDIATGYAMELIPGYDPAAGLWVPAQYRSVRLYGDLPATVWSVATLAKDANFGQGFATFDVTLTDETGHVVAVIEGFTIKHLKADGESAISLTDTHGAVLVEGSDHTEREVSSAMARLATLVEQGIDPEKGGEALRRAVATGLPQIVVSSMDLHLLQKNAAQSGERATSNMSGLDRPNITAEFIAPTTEIEKTLAGFWSELLGIDKIGINDSFFDLGGHSLVAVRLFRMIKKTYSVDFPISVLFDAQTIAQCAQLLERSGARQAEPDAATASEAPSVETTSHPTHLVQMHTGRNPHATPLFVCAGMFGNILNLRHLALQVGRERPVYGLQAQGLYGDQEPHETFEEMAASYLADVRAVQPHGPYLLSGFSGGGLVAYEMAQILKSMGERVDLLVLLDTPYPEDTPITFEDKVTIKLQDMRRDKGAFVGRWVRRRIEWELARFRKSRTQAEHAPEEFHNEKIEAAFRRALGRYRARPYDGPVLLLRPKLEVTYKLRDGRLLHATRNLLKADNGWSPYVTSLTIKEVSGDHDAMVLEPNVRLLAAHLNEALRKRRTDKSVKIPEDMLV